MKGISEVLSRKPSFCNDLFEGNQKESVKKAWLDDKVIYIVVIGRTASVRGIATTHKVKDHIVTAASLRIIDNLA
jgi:hypothetical protein